MQVAAASLATTEDGASLLQTRRHELREHSQQMYNIGVTKTIVNRTFAQCSCAITGCGRFACAPCKQAMCGCLCKLENATCEKCCNGDHDCLQRKLQKAAKKRMEELESSLKYRTDYDKYKRSQVLDNRKEEDTEWQHEVKLRKSVQARRKSDDAAHRKKMQSHNAEKQSQKQLRKSLTKWMAENVEDAIRLANGGTEPPQPPVFFLPDCACPTVWCPPQRGCGKCPEPKCPPCRECKAQLNECPRCEEDKAIMRAVSHFLEGNKMNVCPPKEDYENYCEFKDTWPIDICPVDKECD